MKAEEDLRRVEAEKKKAQMRLRVRSMRNAYSSLASENAAEPLAERQLPVEEMAVDPEMDALLSEKREKALLEVQLATAHESEKAEVLLNKLRSFTSTALHLRVSVFSPKCRERRPRSHSEYPKALDGHHPSIGQGARGG